MNKEELKGKLEGLKGRVKEFFCKDTGNTETQAEGVADQMVGAAREEVGEAESELAEEKKDIARAAKEAAEDSEDH